MVVVNNLDSALALPTHLYRCRLRAALPPRETEPIWPHLEAAAEVRLAMIGDYAYIPTCWRVKAGGLDADGVPSSYYTGAQFVCLPEVVDGSWGKVEILVAQLGDRKPE